MTYTELDELAALRVEKARLMAENVLLKASLKSERDFIDWLQGECDKAQDESAAARKVADAAVAYMQLTDGSAELDAEAFCCLDDAVREYRARAESPPLEARIAKACEKLDELEANER